MVKGRGTMWERLAQWLGQSPGRPPAQRLMERARARLVEKAPVPVFWLFGKTQSGKSAMVRYLTGDDRAHIGQGFRPQTKHSFLYDFPSSEQPLLRFLDTRGLGEVDYDPQEEIEAYHEASQVMIVAVRALDRALEPIQMPLRRIRADRPGRPCVLAITCLHQTYPGEPHPDPDPFAASGSPATLPEALRRSLDWHAEQFDGLVDRMVPIDLTRAEEGFAEPNFGGERLKEALLDFLPDAYAESFRQLDELSGAVDARQRAALGQILFCSMLAATAAAVPVPWVDIPVVAGLQGRLVYRLADLYSPGWGVESASRHGGRFSLLGPAATMVGARLMARQAARELLKAIPGAGTVASAALAYASTYALGKACAWYFERQRAGDVPTTEEFQQVLRQQMTLAKKLWPSGARRRGA